MTPEREELAKAYQILAMFGWDDSTYTHLSRRLPNSDSFLIYPFGYLFEEVTPECLLEVTFDGRVLSGSELEYNQTGYVIHGNIYQARTDVQVIFHCHTPSQVAVSAMEDGLLPLSQWALHFYNRVSYHNYQSLALSHAVHGPELVNDLGDNWVMLMRNHGSLMCGRTIQEALFYTYHLEQACQTQCMMLQSQQKIIQPSAEVCQQSVNDLLSFEKDLGRRDWLAYCRQLERWKAR